MQPKMMAEGNAGRKQMADFGAKEYVLWNNEEIRPRLEKSTETSAIIFIIDLKLSRTLYHCSI